MKINLNQLKTIFNQKRKLFIVIIGTLFILFISFFNFKPKPTTLPKTKPSSFDELIKQTPPISSDFTLPKYTSPSNDSNIKIQTAVQAKKTLKSHLPIYIENFSTSVNIPTTINIYILPNDPNYLIHIDIYGINYHSASTNEDINPYATAFKESFLKIKSLLQEENIDLKDTYFIFGGRQYIQETAETWIKEFNLL